MGDLLSGSTIVQLNDLIYFKKAPLKIILLCVPYILFRVSIGQYCDAENRFHYK